MIESRFQPINQVDSQNLQQVFELAKNKLKQSLDCVSLAPT